MPQAENRLVAKFMNYDETQGPLTDGIAEAEKIIRDFGCKIQNGMIYMLPGLLPPEVNDAIDFLCGEWDYGATKENLQ